MLDRLPAGYPGLAGSDPALSPIIPLPLATAPPGRPAEVIRAGLARDCPRYSGGQYAGAEVEASRQLPFPSYRLPR